MLSGIAGDERRMAVTLYTDAFVVRGQVATRHHRITDILNQPDHDFIVLNDVMLDEFGTRSVAVRSEFAQINLSAVLFAVADNPVQPIPELRTPKIPEQALISIPPFKITGRIHLLPERDLRDALEELTGRFLPVTDAIYWSESVGEARTNAQLVAFNHSRAQILAPHREVDPWEGIARDPGASAGAGGDASPGGDASGGAWPDADFEGRSGT
jgi:hypothetical protein